jgi:hypothetical protein
MGERKSPRRSLQRHQGSGLNLSARQRRHPTADCRWHHFNSAPCSACRCVQLGSNVWALYMSIIHSNLAVYLAIAEEAAAESARIIEASRTPKSEGQPGFVITFDPERKSFKQSFIAIAFAGMYLEALLGLVGNMRLGKDLYKKVDRQTTYEEKLALLGVIDLSIQADCKRFREARNDLMHEKAVALENLGTAEIRRAQVEATFGVKFVKIIQRKFTTTH